MSKFIAGGYNSVNIEWEDKRSTPDMVLSFAGGTCTVRPSYSGSAGRLPLASRTFRGFRKSNRDSTSAYAYTQGRPYVTRLSQSV